RVRLSGDDGFSLIELIVAGLISLFVVGGVMTMLVSINDINRDTQQLIDSQQSVRIALDQIQRDVQIAGVGLLWLLPPTPVIIPRADGGIDIRQNQGGLMAGLIADMGSGTDDFTVDDVTGFSPGMQVAVYDAGGSIDFVTIIAVDTNNDRLSHDGASKAYTVADGTAVARILTISYYLQQIDGVWTMVREKDGANTATIAANIVVAGTSILYWDDSLPSVLFNPNTNSLQLRIRTIEVTLEIETVDTMLNSNIRRSSTLTTRITPRAMVLS
ncbi:MAG: hypothetical protein IH849_00610, partial [Acidobacteria bacterium]|nr:hypothetical protein [Acidobacteriota bacterium]